MKEWLCRSRLHKQLFCPYCCYICQSVCVVRPRSVFVQSPSRGITTALTCCWAPAIVGRWRRRMRFYFRWEDAIFGGLQYRIVSSVAKMSASSRRNDRIRRTNDGRFFSCYGWWSTRVHCCLPGRVCDVIRNVLPIKSTLRNVCYVKRLYCVLSVVSLLSSSSSPLSF